MKQIPIDELHPHPGNPRLAPRDDVVDQIAAQLNGKLDEAHALIVRPNAAGYEIISGHQRALAAKKVGLSEVPCWVREMSDDEAYMALALNNAQGELHPIEIGHHARGFIASGGTAREYAQKISINESTLIDRINADEVVQSAPGRDFNVLKTYFSNLREIHHGLRILWPSLVERMIAENWTKQQTREEVRKATAKHNATERRGVKRETSEARSARLNQYISLQEWGALDDAVKARLLNVEPAGTFNRQQSADIEWAQYSWNPVTGCLHDCPYCYARDIANSKRMEKFYPNGFAPTFRPSSVAIPRTMKVPKEADTDWRFRNVFTCSMADLFGRWVPAEWIDVVLREMRDAPQWTFLCLTKFPKRMSEFDIPDNVWMGTTVDLQARVKAAESGFAKVNAKVKWLSVEPLLEPLKFERLDLFDWIVVGGASASTKTPEWHPPSEWVHDLYAQARAAGLAWYEKSNLWAKSTPRTLELPGGLPVTQDQSDLPESFHYLGRARTSDQKAEVAV